MVDLRFQQGERTRRRILEAGIELLGEAGADAFTASALARAAGVSKATLFHHFTTLDEVALEAFVQLFAPTLEPGTKRAGLVGYVAKLGRDTLEIASSNTAFLRTYFGFLVRALFDARYKEQIVRRGRTLHDQMVAQLAPRLPPKTTATEVEDLARLLEAALDGLALSYLIHGSTREYRRSWSLLQEMVASRYGAAG
jgi:AcrR family transcriptional regulator